MELVGTAEAPALIAESEGIRVFAVRWPVYGDVEAEGLLLEPTGEVVADVVAMADCDVTPEQYAGLAVGVGPLSQVARLLAEAGCRVVVPTLLDRSSTFSGNPEVRSTNLTHREWIWRQAFEAGRHPIGYEVDAVRAAVDWFPRDGQPDRPVGVVGHGEGGLIALHAAALDTRIDAAWIGGYFGSRQEVWKEPVYRDVWGLLEEFGDAEVASLIVPRALVIETSAGPRVEGPPPAVDGRSLAASGSLVGPNARRGRGRVRAVRGPGRGPLGHADPARPAARTSRTTSPTPPDGSSSAGCSGRSPPRRRRPRTPSGRSGPTPATADPGRQSTRCPTPSPVRAAGSGPWRAIPGAAPRLRIASL